MTKLPAQILQEYSRNNTFPDDWQISENTVIRRDSVIYRAYSEHLKADIALKVYNNQNEMAAKMYSALQLYYYKSEAGNTVPKPYAFFSEHNAIMMEWIDAPTCRDLIFGKERDRLIKASASWLSWYHKQTLETKSYDNSSRLKMIDKMLAKIELKDNLLQPCLEVLRNAHNKFGHIEIDHAIIHKDFTPANIFISENKTIGYDFLGNKQDPVTHDICRFLVHLSVLRKKPVSVPELKKYGCSERDYNLFMSEYNGTPIPHNIFLYMQYTEIMRRWVSILELRVTRKQSIAVLLKQTINLKRISRMAKHLSESVKS